MIASISKVLQITDEDRYTDEKTKNVSYGWQPPPSPPPRTTETEEMRELREVRELLRDLLKEPRK